MVEVNNKVTLTRRVGRSQVRAKMIEVHTNEEGITTYDIQTSNGTICIQQTEFSMVKASTGSRASQIRTENKNLDLLSEKNIYQDEIITKLRQT